MLLSVAKQGGLVEKVSRSLKTLQGQKHTRETLFSGVSEQIKAINFTITFDLKFPFSSLRAIHELLALINEKLWIGHFDITSKNGIPAFRHTLLVSQKNENLYNQLEELVDIAIYECEKYYPAFQLILFKESQPREALELCLLEPIGRA